MTRLASDVIGALDELLAVADAAMAARYPGGATGRQPVHTVYVPADAIHPGLIAQWGRDALAALPAHAPMDEAIRARVEAKLHREPIEDLRIDFEDGYGVRPDAEEDAAAVRAVTALLAGPVPPFVGVRCKSLEAATRRRAVATIELVLEAFLSAGPLPAGFVITLPKVSVVEQVDAMVLLCGALEQAYGLSSGQLRFEIQVETPPAILAADGTATVARMVHAAAGRCVGLHYGAYDYSAACGIAAAYQAMDHPVADHAKAVMQVAAAGTGVRLSDGSTNILPIGSPDEVRAAGVLHARLVRRSLERGFYQGWDLHPAQLPTRYAATYAFFREGLEAATVRLRAYLDRRSTGVLDEPATARALAGFLLRGLDCGAADESEVAFDRSTLESQ
jgi:citrate lyase beta subunit